MIRIKDVAQLAGVSVGTVDRVLHDRPNVSAKAREKVEAALKEMDYKPNAYASALAYNKSFTFCIILPKVEQGNYWAEVLAGAEEAEQRRRDFHVRLQMMSYDRFTPGSFSTTAGECLDMKPDGVIVVPDRLDVTKAFVDELHLIDIPYILLDGYMPDLRPLSFYGQDSFASGYFAGRMFAFLAAKESEVALMKQEKNGVSGSKQQENRETGFRHFMGDHLPEVKILELVLPMEASETELTSQLDAFFEQHPMLHHCITFNSQAYIIGEYLQRNNRRQVQVMGYDLISRNAECLRQGSISFLIAQHGYMQGYGCVQTLFEAVVLRQQVTPVNYMPIEFITKENMEFYHQHPKI
ncbi:MAG: substrate-binding domain-containing protein [Prevotella sp.]|nr:substrate-binding domain-containing protein [Prevotella sp.]